MLIRFKEKEAEIQNLISSYILRRTIRTKFQKDILKSHVTKCGVAETVIFADKMNWYTNTYMHKSKFFVGTKTLSSFDWRRAEIKHEQNSKKPYNSRAELRFFFLELLEYL